MKALILAAGLGTRLRPLTEKTPKPLLPIAGKPLLSYHLESLSKHGVTDVLINTHYLPQQMEEFIANARIANPKLRISTAFEPELLGSAGTLRQNEAFFDGEDNFIITYGDNLTGIDYSKLMKQHLETGSAMTVACYEEKHPESKGIVTLGPGKRIVGFIEKPKREQVTSPFANGGIYAANRRIFEYIKRAEQSPLDFGHHIFPLLLAHGESVHAYLMNELLLDIGTPESYTKAQQLVAELQAGATAKSQ